MMISKKWLTVFILALLILFFLALGLIMTIPPKTVPSGDVSDKTEQKVRIIGHLTEMPFPFVAVEGLFDPTVEFAAVNPGFPCMFSSDKIVTIQKEAVISQRYEGSSTYNCLEGKNQLEGTANFFIGNDSSEWCTDTNIYDTIICRDLYPCIDLVYDGKNSTLRREFVVEPGADPSVIRIHYDGIQRIVPDSSGGLSLITEANGNVQSAIILNESPLFCYQEITGVKKTVSAGYRIINENDVGFTIGQYDTQYPLVISFESTYMSTFNDNTDYSFIFDDSGNMYLTGDILLSGFSDIQKRAKYAFVTKMNPEGSEIIYSSYFGGDEYDKANAIAVDDSGNVYVTGSTKSVNFPIIPNVFQHNLEGKTNPFIIKLNPSGNQIVYSTYLGGSSYDNAYGIAVDNSGNAYITGSTKSANFPTTPGAYRSSCSKSGYDAFVTKLDPDGRSLLYSTLIGPTGGLLTQFGIAVDESGNAYITGTTNDAGFPTTAEAYDRQSPLPYYKAFVTKLDPEGSDLIYSTYLGSWFTQGKGIMIDNEGSAYITGNTGTKTFPTTSGAYQAGLKGVLDAFVVKLDSNGSKIICSTLVGLSENIGLDGRSIALDDAGNIYVTGFTGSTFSSYSIDPDLVAYAANFWNDPFIAMFDPDCSRLISSYPVLVETH